MLKLLSSRHIISILHKHGFIEVSQKGSHKKFRCAQHTVIVPHPKKEIPLGTLRSIIRQSGLEPNSFK